jgi:hypothetical protein
MKVRYVAALVLATAAMSASSSESDLVRSGGDSASAVGCQGNGLCLSLSAAKFQDVGGVLQGSVSIILSGPIAPFVQILQCRGPTLAQALSLNSATGHTAITATLDPASLECTSRNVSGPISVDISGGFDGASHNTNVGLSTHYFRGDVTRSRTRTDSFTTTLEGTVGSFTGLLVGNAAASTSIRIEQQIVPQN